MFITNDYGPNVAAAYALLSEWQFVEVYTYGQVDIHVVFAGDGSTQVAEVFAEDKSIYYENAEYPEPAITPEEAIASALSSVLITQSVRQSD